MVIKIPGALICLQFNDGLGSSGQGLFPTSIPLTHSPLEHVACHSPFTRLTYHMLFKIYELYGAAFARGYSFQANTRKPGQCGRMHPELGAGCRHPELVALIEIHRTLLGSRGSHSSAILPKRRRTLSQSAPGPNPSPARAARIGGTIAIQIDWLFSATYQQHALRIDFPFQIDRLSPICGLPKLRCRFSRQCRPRLGDLRHWWIATGNCLPVHDGVNLLESVGYVSTNKWRCSCYE
jgi:hypothetical protein